MNIKTLSGFIYILGDDINTDDIVPSYTLTIRDPKEIAKHTLEMIDPQFVKEISKKSIIIAGENFGTGSSREEAVNVLKILGIKAIIAKSFARIYFRNLINQGIPAISLKWKKEDFSNGDNIEILLTQGQLLNKTKNKNITFNKLPDFIMDILIQGGILKKLSKKLTKN